MTLLMMGSAEALPEEPAVRPMFVEDMTDEQLASAVSTRMWAGFISLKMFDLFLFIDFIFDIIFIGLFNCFCLLVFFVFF